MRALLLLALLAAPLRADDARIENEVMLAVPDEQEEALWTWLQERFAAGPRSLLPELGPGFSATFSDEAFTDRYFDTPDLAVLERQGGVRHRTRRNLGDASKDRKHGRQLVQVKLARPGEALNRSEIKFDVDPPANRRDALDRHALLGLVSREDRARLVATLAAAGVDGEALQETLTIHQRRRRAYVARDGQPFATLTIDHVTSSFGPASVQLVGLDVELSEVAYTAASATQREEMSAVSRRLVAEVLKAFPDIRQDQTPKYNRVFAALDARLPRFRWLLLHGGTLSVALLLGVPLLGLLLWEVRARRRRARVSP